jgi:hypothetical protein
MLAAATVEVPVLAAVRIVADSEEVAVPVAVIFTASFSAAELAAATAVDVSLIL